MSSKAAATSRTSLYRLENLTTLRSAVQDKYLKRDTFTTTDVKVGAREAVLVAGTIDTETVKWAKTIHTLTDHPLGVGNMIAAAVLIIGDPEVSPEDVVNNEGASEDSSGEQSSDSEEVPQLAAWALTYGMGFQLLRQSNVDGGFGQRIAIRVADPGELNSLTRTTLDQRARVDRLSNPSGDHLRGYGVGDFGELVTRLVAKAKIPSLTGGKERAIRIRGADALSVPLGRKPGELLADLDALIAILSQPAAAGLEVLEQLVAIKNRPDLTDRLDERLNVALQDADSAKLGLGWPHERIDDNGTPSSYRIMGAGRSHSAVRDGTPDVDALVAALAAESPDKKLHRLRRLGVMLFRDEAGDEPVSPAIPGDRWIAFETDEADKRYCFHDGRWFLMDEDYAKKLGAQTDRIFNRDAQVNLPTWKDGWDEAAYNAHVVESLGGFLLDKRLIYTDLHRRGIEVCDVLLPDGALVHIKSIEKSAPASHLLAQALVSTDALLHDQQARAAFVSRVEELGGTADDVPQRVERVVLGLAKPGNPVTGADLFTFTQVTLVRHVTALEGRGVAVYVVPIVRPM